MPYRLIAIDTDGSDLVSSAMDTIDDAVDLARALRKDGVKPIWISGTAGVGMTKDELETALKAKPRRKKRER